MHMESSVAYLWNFDIAFMFLTDTEKRIICGATVNFWITMTVYADY